MSANKSKYLIILAGPTAVGKTSTSIKLAKMLDAEVFSCDSRQLYKEMTIGTAKPSDEELTEVKHHFIGTQSILETYSAGDYERAVDLAFAEYFQNKTTAILTGGTGLYINAVTKGLDDFPTINQVVLNELNTKAADGNLDELLAELQVKDPITYKTIDKENSRRVVRALSVCLVEGKPYSSYLRKAEKELDYTPIFIFLERDRAELYQRINKRVDLMMAAGLEKEARKLYIHQDKKALKTVGYSELFNYFEGKHTYSEAVELIKRNSRRYAKRQMTWFRNQGNYKNIDAADFDNLLDYVKSQIS